MQALRREHSGELADGTLRTALEDANRVTSYQGEGADIILNSGRGRELATFGGNWDNKNIYSNLEYVLQVEARQLGVDEVYVQLNSTVVRSGIEVSVPNSEVVNLMNEMLETGTTQRSLGGKLIVIFNNAGEEVWRGVIPYVEFEG